ncbi:MAG: hypothetical protein GYB68_02450 [Chloroflexi bacterium]|nr:hypothetical protein [Chloroflexota bacterium]
MLGASALSKLTQNTALDFALPIDPQSIELPLLDSWFTSTDAQERTAAEQVAQRISQRLVWLLTSLRESDTPWSTVRQFWLGGGIVSGQLGWRMAKAARNRLSDSVVYVAPHPNNLPLIGALRYAASDTPHSLAIDLGGTAIKRGVGSFEEQRLRQINVLPTLTAPQLYYHQAVTIEQMQTLLDSIVDIVAESWVLAQNRHEVSLSSRIPISIASYIEGGRLTTPDTYGNLQGLAPDVFALLSERLSERLGLAIDVELIHDGTAAAAALAGPPESGVIMMGTALGGSVSPDPAGLHSVNLDALVMRGPH